MKVSCLTAFKLGHLNIRGFFPAFQLELKRWPFLGLKPANVQDGTYTIGSPGPPACQLQVSGLVSLRNCVSQFLLQNQSLLSLFLSLHSPQPLCMVSMIRGQENDLTVLAKWPALGVLNLFWLLCREKCHLSAILYVT